MCCYLVLQKPLNVLESVDETSLDQLSVLQNSDFSVAFLYQFPSCQVFCKDLYILPLLSLHRGLDFCLFSAL